MFEFDLSLRDVGNNPTRDAIVDVIKGVARRTVSPHWDVFVHRERFLDLRAGDPDGTLTTYSLMKPNVFTGFANVTLASACIEDTMLVRLWRSQGYAFGVVDDSLRDDLRFKEPYHSNGDLVTIYYATEHAWSKSQRDKTVEADGCRVPFIDHVYAAIANLFRDEPIVWMGNEDLPGDIFGALRAERLPNSPHGLNGFQYAHNVVVLSALNPPPDHFRFLNQCAEIEAEEVRTAHYRTAVYQAVMRCSIRNPSDRTPKRVVVMDRETAEWLAKRFPGAAVLPLPGIQASPVVGKPGRPRRHASPADRAKAYRAAKKAKTALGSTPAGTGIKRLATA